ncbi:MAG: GAF domain-containing protein, partial [Candidatus Angelobacter sp.]
MAEVFSELDEETIHKRWPHLNVILRLSMLAGLQMQLEATLNLLSDMAAEITNFDKVLVYFWDDAQEQMQLRLERGLPAKEQAAEFSSGNVLNLWAVKYGRPLLVHKGHHIQADALLGNLQAGSALAVPLFVSNRVMGSLQLFSAGNDTFV